MKKLFTVLFFITLLGSLYAQTYSTGTVTLNSSNNYTVSISVDVPNDEVTITMSGSSSKWWGIGFDATAMGDQPYTIIGNSSSGTVMERQLGNHNAGSLLTSEVTVTSDETSGSVRTITMTRAINGSKYNFPTTETSVSIIWAVGSGTTFQYHATRSSSLLTFIKDCPVMAPTTLASATICEGDSALIFGNYESVSAMYYDTLQDINGCDSILEKELIVNPTFLNSLSEITICEGDSALIFGTYRFEGGTYSDSLQSVNGCDSIMEQFLTVVPTDTTVLSSLEICDGDSILIFGAYRSSAGIYYDTLQSVINCDSILQQELKVNPVFATGPVDKFFCMGDSILISGEYEYTEGTYFDSLQSITGCDSIVTINLVNNSTDSTTNITACDSYISPSGNYTWTTSGTYTDTLPNAAGCDSIITVNLNIKNATNSTEIVTTCDSYDWNGKTYTSSGTFKDTLTNSVGCDSVMTLDLTINNSSDSTYAQTACDSLVSPSGKYTWMVSGVYKDTLQNSAGCDSLITINLTINTSNSSSIDPVVCDSYVSPSGKFVWTNSGTYKDTLQNVAGCDSVINIDLMIRNSSDTTFKATGCNSYNSPSGKYIWTGSGTYMDTLQNNTGCDSVLTIHLTINKTTKSTINPVTCDSLKSPSGNYSWTETGTYKDTITNKAGCDSIITVNLTIIKDSASTITAVTCDSYTSPSGNYIWTESGIYIDTIPNTGNCDSIFVTVDLTINNSTTSSDTVTACNSYKWNGITYKASGTYVDTLTNTSGCDSIMTLNLTILKSTSATIDTAVCYSYTSPDGDEFWTVSGTYMDTIPNATGCDSIITIKLKINESTSFSDTVSACFSYNWNGNTYSTSGTYIDTISNAAGCDSIMSMHLTINEVDTSVTVNDTALISTASGVMYQWLDCDNNADSIPSATGQSFSPATNGIYAVMIEDNGCIDTSSCHSFIRIAVIENTLEYSLRVFPNPTTGNVAVDLGREYGYIFVKVKSITGELIFTGKFERSTLINFAIEGAPGFYVVEINVGDEPQIGKNLNSTQSARLKMMKR